jgi:membrane protease YdiL (CAAX protease family)
LVPELPSPDAVALTDPPPLTSGDTEPAARLPVTTYGWRSLSEVFLCSGYPSQFLLGAVLQVAGIAPRDGLGALSARFVFALSLLDTALLLGLIVFLLHRRGERPFVVLFGTRPLLREAFAGVASLPLVLTVVVVASLSIRLVVPALHNVEQNPLEGLLGSQTGLFAFLIVVIVAGGIREELQRVFLLHRFAQDLGGARFGLLCTSVAFGLGHTLQGWDAAIITGLLGAIWGALSLARGGAAASLVSHSLFNSAELIRAVMR